MQGLGFSKPFSRWVLQYEGNSHYIITVVFQMNIMNHCLWNAVYETQFIKWLFSKCSCELILLPSVGLCNCCYETNCYEPKFIKHGGFNHSYISFRSTTLKAIARVKTMKVCKCMWAFIIVFNVWHRCLHVLNRRVGTRNKGHTHRSMIKSQHRLIIV